MRNVTTAEVRHRILFDDDKTLDVRPVVADRINSRATMRRLGVAEDNHEIRAYVVAHTAAKRTGDYTDDFETFAAHVVDVSLVTTTGDPIRARDGVLYVDDTEVDQDPTQPDHSNAG